MKLRNALVASALAAALLVPAAGAKPGNGNGNGNGNGPPASASGGKGGAKANGKPAWAGQGQARKAEKAQRKLERRAARAAAVAPDEVGPKHLNPAWVCKFEREEMGAEAFAQEYGNKANAFGKCVSQEAHERDGVAADDEETPEPGESEDGESSDDGGSAVADALAALESFLQSLKQLL